MNKYSYKGEIITASSKKEAINKILGTKVYSYKNRIDKKLLDKSSQMIERFNRKFPRPDAKMYENYKGEINKDTLMQAWKDGREARRSFTFEFKGDNTEKKIKSRLEKFEKYVLPVYLDLVAGKTLKVYRGIHARPSNVKYIILNLLKENSWSFDSRVAQAYAKSTFANKKDTIYFILIRECKLKDTNIMLSAFNEGYWCEYGSNAMGGANDEIILNKSFNIGKIKIYPLDDSSKQQLIDLGYSSKLTDSL